MAEGIPIVHNFPFKLLPIVEAGAAEVIVVYPKAERAHQPQLRPDGKARPADAPRVVRDLRLVENDVEQGIVLHVAERDRVPEMEWSL